MNKTVRWIIHHSNRRLQTQSIQSTDRAKSPQIIHNSTIRAKLQTRDANNSLRDQYIKSIYHSLSQYTNLIGNVAHPITLYILRVNFYIKRATPTTHTSAALHRANNMPKLWWNFLHKSWFGSPSNNPSFKKLKTKTFSKMVRRAWCVVHKKYFKNAEELDAPMIAQHYDLYCSICERIFVNRTALRLHARKVHNQNIINNQSKNQSQVSQSINQDTSKN